MSNFWTICFPNAMCVPKSLVKIFVSIGIVARNRRASARRRSRSGGTSHHGRVCAFAAAGSAIYFPFPFTCPLFHSASVAFTSFPLWHRAHACSRVSVSPYRIRVKWKSWFSAFFPDHFLLLVALRARHLGPGEVELVVVDAVPLPAVGDLRRVAVDA